MVPVSHVQLTTVKENHVSGFEGFREVTRVKEGITPVLLS